MAGGSSLAGSQVAVGITAGFGVFHAREPSAAHRPHATKLLVPLDAPIVVELVDEQRRIETRTPIALAPEIRHAVHADAPRLTCFVEPEGRGAALTNFIKANSHDGSLQFDRARAAAIHEAARELEPRLHDPAAVDRFRQLCLKDLELGHAPALDPRIRAVIRRLVESHEHRFVLEDLASVAGLSPRWLSKLFKEKVGTSLRRYSRWLKLADSVQFACKTDKLTASALAAGFADLPHFSRSVSELMGSAPSRVPFARAVVHADFFSDYRAAAPWDTPPSTD